MLATRLCFLLRSLTLAAASAVPQPPGLDGDQVLLSPVEPSGFNTPNPYPNSTWGAIKAVFKRNCYWDNGDYCDGTGVLCCMNLKSDLGFCCGGNDFGPCCGSTCCGKGYHCAYADQTTSSCCLDGDSCGGLPTKTEVVQETVSVVTTLEVVTTDDSGRTITELLTSTAERVDGGVADPTTGPDPAQASGSSPESGADNTGAIVGGVVGGAALLMICGVLLFIGHRRGWFEKRRPVMGPDGEPKVPSGGPLSPRHLHASAYSYDGQTLAGEERHRGRLGRRVTLRCRRIEQGELAGR